MGSLPATQREERIWKKKGGSYSIIPQLNRVGGKMGGGGVAQKHGPIDCCIFSVVVLGHK